MPVQARRPRAARARHSAPAGNAPYALPYVTYNPTWPSILSVAHDEADGAALFVITDRPCLLSGAADALPLTVHGAGGAPRVVLGATQVLPFKFKLTLTGAVPRGAAWSWGPPTPGGANLYDPITNNRLNAAAGDCADVPGPYTPPPPAVVTYASAIGNEAHLFFGQYLALTGTPIPDGAFTFDGFTPSTVLRPGPYELAFTTPNSLTMGSTWAVNVQPAWLATALEVPQAGVF